MNRFFRGTIILLIALFLNPCKIRAGAKFEGGVQVGYNGGMGWQLSALTSQFAQGFPFQIRANLGVSYLDPGNASAARKIFINNNQGGTIEKHGHTLGLGIDFLYPKRLLNLSESYLYFGPRYASFRGNFKFIGDNEDFDVTSHHWGLGIGAESRFPVSHKIVLAISVGLEYFFPSTLYGHDTSYSPDGEAVNPREDYTYKDADKAVNQPGLEFKLMAGISYRLGK